MMSWRSKRTKGIVLTIIEAKYPGVCCHCGRRHISPGDQIESLPEGGWKAVYCSGPKIPPRKPGKPKQTSLPAPLDAERRRRTPCDAIAEEIARFRANPIDPPDWIGWEDFY